MLSLSFCYFYSYEQSLPLSYLSGLSPVPIIFLRAKDEILFIGFSEEADILFSLDPSHFLDFPLHFQVVSWREVYFGVSDDHSVQVGEEAEVVFEDWVLELAYVLLEIFLDALPSDH